MILPVTHTNKPITQVIYISVAKTEFSKEALEALLCTSRKNNESRNVTGLMIYDKGSFIQVLEGDERDVLALLTIIRADPRHTKLRILSQSERSIKEFDSWSMGFVDLSDIEAPIDGYVPYDALDQAVWIGSVSETYIRRFLAGKLRDQVQQG
jgi:hypothetical protein